MLPSGAELLHVAYQHSEICIWYRCDPKAPKIPFHIRIVGTGHPIPDGKWTYIGSAFYETPDLVFHVFEGFE